MKRNFYLGLMAALVLFALVSLGGCGGSSSNSSGREGEDNYIDIPRASETITINEMRSVSMASLDQEIEDEALFARLNEVGLYMCLIDESSDQVLSIPLHTESGDVEVVTFGQLKEKYDAGSVIMLFDPEEREINMLLDALDEDANYTLPEGVIELELYAIAKRKASNGTEHTFVYQIPQRKDFNFELGEIESVDVEGLEELLSGDLSSLESEDAVEFEEYAGITEEQLEQYELEAQVARWREFFEWCAYGIDERLETAGAEAAMFASAATGSELSKIAEGYHTAINYSRHGTYTPFSNNGGRYDRYLKRETTANYTVYTCHSYATGSDFYLVKADLSTTPDYKYTNPQRNYDNGSPAFYTEYHAGFTDYIINSAYIEGVGEDTNKALLIDKLPKESIPKSTTISKNMTWNAGGSIGFNGLGATGSITGGVSYSDTQTYTTQEWTIEDKSKLTYPWFVAQFKREYNEGGPHTSSHFFLDITSDRDRWQDLRVDGGTKQRINLSNQWVWEVKKAHWQNVEKVNIFGDVRIGERFAYGGGYCGRNVGGSKGDLYLKNGKAMTEEVSRAQNLNAPAPDHLYVSTRNITVKSTGENPTFNLLCSGNWTVSSDSDWCRVDQSTQSGTDTGDVYTQIKLYIDPHPEAGQAENTRTAKIIAKEQRSLVLNKKRWHWYEGHPTKTTYYFFGRRELTESKKDGVNGYWEEYQVKVEGTSKDITVRQSTKD